MLPPHKQEDRVALLIEPRKMQYIPFELESDEATALEHEVNLDLFGARVSEDQKILMVPDHGDSVSELERWISGVADHVEYPYNMALRRICDKLIYHIS